MQRAIDETERRRTKQLAFNAEHGITPKGIQKAVKEIIEGVPGERAAGRYRRRDRRVLDEVAEEAARYEHMDAAALAREIKGLEKAMFEHARNLEFEEAAALRDRIDAIRELSFGPVSEAGTGG
jgi:excinuclease ABC subunit B